MNTRYIQGLIITITKFIIKIFNISTESSPSAVSSISFISIVNTF